LIATARYESALVSGRGQRRLDGAVDVVQLVRAHVTLEGGDVRLVGRVQSEPVRDALSHPGVPATGVLECRVVRVDKDVDRAPPSGV
jgi:hypothetical protein